jgi:tetraacyldisaccharide 4'-kinase
MPSVLWQREETTARKLLLSPLLVAEGAWRVGAWLHRASYERGLRRRVRVPLRVVSVGNLAVGGSGKTPVVAWLARELRARGEKVAVLSRGVGGKRLREVNVVSDGARVLLGPEAVGDEPVWIAGSARGVPVLAGRNRVALALRARALFGAEVALLDDGFQHHRLARDVDLVCIDAGLGLGNGHVLPRGPLRESPRVLRRADAVLWTRAGKDFRPPDLPTVRGRPHHVVAIVPTGLRDLESGRSGPLSPLEGEAIGILVAIARPDRLAGDLERLGARVLGRRFFPDHHLYREADLAPLDPTLLWVTTAKDAVKIPLEWVKGKRVAVLEEEVRVADGAKLLDFVLSRPRRAGARGA